MIEGILVRDYINDRYQIEYGIESYTDGFLCGETLQANIDGEWTDTRMEYKDDWYLVGYKDILLDGLKVRTYD